MSTRRVLVLDDFAPLDVVRAELAGTDVHVVDRADLPATAWERDGAGVVGLLSGPEIPISAEQVDLLPDLAVVAVTSTGSDHVPLERARARGLWVTSAAGYCTQEVADHTLAAGLALLRGLPLLDEQVRSGGWDVTAVAPRPFAAARWGVVGFGRIGQAVADRARALGMAVAAWDPYSRNASGATDDLLSLCARSDVLSLHVPLTPQTTGLIGPAELAALPAGAFVINVARGGVLDQAALAQELRSGRLGGGALDVFDVEPLPADDPVRTLPRTLLSPHAAWYSEQAAVLPFVRAAQAVRAVLAGRRPDGVIVHDPTVAAVGTEGAR